MNPARARTALAVAAAFGAPLLCSAIASGYVFLKTEQAAVEIGALEQTLRQLDATLKPIGDLDKLRAQYLERKPVVEVVQQLAREVQAVLGIPARLAPAVQLQQLAVQARQLTLQARCTNAPASQSVVDAVQAAGFTTATISTRRPDTSASGAELITITARTDAWQFANVVPTATP